MRTKLQNSEPLILLRPVDIYRGQLGTAAPHLLYANLEFGKPDSAKKARSLLTVPGWTDAKALTYLAQRQPEFRRCLEWLTDRAHKNLGIEDDASDDFESRMSDIWTNEPEVRFLQQHGLEHAKIRLEPASQEGCSFGGLVLNQGEPKDPLDPICGYLLALLAWNGTVGVRKCRFVKCGKFYRSVTNRRLFCSAICRAKNGAAKKSPEEKRLYMRERRELLKRREVQKHRTLPIR
jgi:hypothetical protein